MSRRWPIKLYLRISGILNMNLSLGSSICIIFIKFVGKKTIQSILRTICFLKGMNKTFLKSKERKNNLENMITKVLKNK